MKDSLAEKLLARVLQWGPEDVAQERPILQALAAFKYDEYQQYSAGSRFIESLMLWLNQFKTIAERRTAYEFIKTKLIFCSAAEMRHLVEMAYPDHVRPILIDRTANELNLDPMKPATIAARKEFKIRQRQCLFLGLSDGSRIDTFRRANHGDLNHEQISQSYELSNKRVDKLLKKLGEHIQQITGSKPNSEEGKFRTLILLDDFSASGTSYYALPSDNPPGGKVIEIFNDLFDKNKPASQLFDPQYLEVIILLYLATEQALDHLRLASNASWGSKQIRCSVEVVQPLPPSIKITSSSNEPIKELIENINYYDHNLFDSHFEKGGTEDARYGYAGCGLPLVLHHNSPNNSLSLLMSYEDLNFRGLFPRIQRHKEMS